MSEAAPAAKTFLRAPVIGVFADGEYGPSPELEHTTDRRANELMGFTALFQTLFAGTGTCGPVCGSLTFRIKKGFSYIRLEWC